MKCTPQQDERLRQRFVEAFEKAAGGNADLFGRQLGYLNGGYVRQVVGGEKPVRQAIIERVSAIPGYAGWFDGLVPWHQSSIPTPDTRKFSLAALELAGAFDRVPDGREKLRVYAVLLDELRRAALPAAAPQTPAPAPRPIDAHHQRR